MRWVSPAVLLALLLIGSVWWIAVGRRSLEGELPRVEAAAPERAYRDPSTGAEVAEGSEPGIAPAAREEVRGEAGTARPTGPPAGPPVGEVFALSGRVVSALDGAPVPDFTLNVVGAAGETCQVVTDAGGGFETPAVLHAGVAVLSHLPDATHLRLQFEHDVSPDQILVPPVEPGTGLPLQEVVVQITPPTAIVLARVLFSDDTPAPGARVVLLEYTSDRWDLPRRVRTKTADSAGLARFAVHSRGDELEALELYADLVERDLVSDLLAPDTDWESGVRKPVTLTLFEAGSVRVRVRDESGRPLEGARVFSVWSVIRSTFFSLFQIHQTDERGEFLFRGLSPGTHTVKVQDPRNRKDFRQEVEVQRGVEIPVDFDLPAANTELAMSGRVVDEDGAPLPGVFISIEKLGEERLWGTRSDESGAFELWSRPVPGLVLRAGTELDADLFEPAEMEVQFGAQDLVFRRRRVLETRRLSFHVVHAVSGDGVQGAEVWLYDPKLERDFPSVRAGTTGPDGSALVSLKLRDDLIWGVHAPGFLQHQGVVAEIDLDEAAPRVEVRLERGFDRRWQIRDWFSSVPLPGATVRDPESRSVLGIADEQGWVHLRSHLWPENLEVSHPGYETAIWPVARRNGWPHDGISLKSEKLQEQMEEWERNR